MVPQYGGLGPGDPHLKYKIRAPGQNQENIKLEAVS